MGRIHLCAARTWLVYRGLVSPLVTVIVPAVQARGLLLVLNNAEWAGQRANVNLVSAYKSVGYPSVEHLERRLGEAWAEGLRELAARYVSLRAHSLANMPRLKLRELASQVAGRAAAGGAGADSSSAVLSGECFCVCVCFVLFVCR